MPNPYSIKSKEEYAKGQYWKVWLRNERHPASVDTRMGENYPNQIIRSPNVLLGAGFLSFKIHL